MEWWLEVEDSSRREVAMEASSGCWARLEPFWIEHDGLKW
jgi:hypothetical protein